MGLRSMALVAVVSVVPLAVPARQVEEQVVVSTVRFYRAEASLTQVKAFVQVPLAVLTPSPSGTLSYRVAVQLKDSTGLKLDETAWPQQHVAAAMREPGAFTVNSMEFNIRPGRYRLEVTVEDSVTGRLLTTGSDLIGYGARPAASDLVLSTRMRPFQADSGFQDTEWKSGQILVTSIAQVQLNPARANGSRIFYLLEAYPPAADSGTMQVRIEDASGKVWVTTAPARVQLAAGGGVLRGQLNLEGLPSGQYSLRVGLTLSGGTTERAAPFGVADLQAELQREATLAQARRLTDEGYFAGMSEPELDQAEEPLDYLGSSRELRAYKGATLEAKRRFLTDFWHRRDPDTSTARNEAREEFYGKLAYADSTFRERGARTTPGWKTDRGRIYAKYGGYDEILDRVRAGRAPPYQVWRYTRRRDLWYIFVDRSGLGAYKVIHSNDRTEPGAPDWTELLGPDALRDVGLFLGQDFFANRGGAAPNQ